MNKSKLAALLLLGVLIGAPLWVGFSALATDISTSDWSETDASNSQTAPAGFPEGMAPSGVNNAARAVMGAAKRFWNRINATVTSGGGSGVYTLSYSVAPSTYVNGETFSFKANHTNGSTGASLNISSLGAKTLVKPSTNGLIALSASDIAANNHVIVQYDSGVDQFVIVSMLPTTASGGTVTSITAGTGLSGGTITGTGTIALDINSLTEETSVQAATDFVPMYDVSGAVTRKVTPANLIALAATRAVFEASATWTKPSGVASTTMMKMTVVGGGGGGGASGDTGEWGGGGGGGGGGTGIRWRPFSALGATEAVTVGAAAAAAGSGNTSSFGSHCSATGGAAGSASTSAAAPGAGGAGGAGSGCDVNIEGDDGQTGQPGITATLDGPGGHGGRSTHGGGGRAGVAAAGTAGNNYGGGGAGGTNALAGGASAGGLVILEWMQ